MNKVELKPCPLCGGKAELQHQPLEFMFSRQDYYSYVKCESCGAQSGNVCISAQYCADDKAAEAWNMRIKKAD